MSEVLDKIRETYQIEFPIFEKIHVNGKDSHEVFKYLRLRCHDFNKTKKNRAKYIPWNFSKFILNSEGKPVTYIPCKSSIMDKRGLIEELLGIGG